MITHDPQSNVTRLKVSRNVYNNITSKTVGEHKPKAGEFYIRDDKLTGFWIRVDPRGRKVYGCYGRLFGVGKTVRVTIGNTELYTAAQARAEAEKHLRDIRSGIDPKAIAKADAEKTSDTLESLMELYLDTKKDDLRPRTIYDFQYRLRQNMSALLRKDVRELTAEDLRQWWSTKQGRKDPKGSKRVCLAYLSAILNFANALGIIDNRNVAHDFKKVIGNRQGVRKGSPKKRHIRKNQIKSWVWSFISYFLYREQIALPKLETRKTSS